MVYMDVVQIKQQLFAKKPKKPKKKTMKDVFQLIKSKVKK